MNIGELIRVLTEIEKEHGSHIAVTVCDLDDDADESFHFHRTNGCEVVSSGDHSKFTFVSIYTNKR